MARTYGPIELLSRFQELAPQLPLPHARANLPGKALLFHLLLVVTHSSAAMGLLIVIASTCGAALVYLLAREWFGDRRAALFAFAFYVFMPARIYSVPILNTLTPVFLLIPMCLLELHFRTRSTWPLLVMGIASYWLLIFEPLPFAATPIVLWQVIRRVQRGDLRWAEAGRAVVYPALSLLGVYIAVRLLFGFDAVAAFRFALQDARRFNVLTSRPYWLWVGHNLKDFFLHVGPGVAILFFIALWSPVRTRSADLWLAPSLAAVLIVLTLLGINRGEVVRLWIFVGTLMLIAAAHACASRPPAFRIALTIAIVQTAVLVQSIGWVVTG